MEKLALFEISKKRTENSDLRVGRVTDVNGMGFLHHLPEIKSKDNYLNISQKLIKGQYKIESKFTLLYLYEPNELDEATQFIKSYGRDLHNKTNSLITIITYFTKDYIDDLRYGLDKENELKNSKFSEKEKVKKLIDELKEIYDIKSLPAIVFLDKDKRGNEKSFVIELGKLLAGDINKRFDDIIDIIKENENESFEFFKEKLNEGSENVQEYENSFNNLCTFNYIEDIRKNKSCEIGKIRDIDIANELNISDRSFRDKRTYNKFSRDECITMAFFFKLSVEETNTLLKLNGHNDLDKNDRDLIIQKALNEKWDLYNTNKLLNDKRLPPITN